MKLETTDCLHGYFHLNAQFVVSQAGNRAYTIRLKSSLLRYVYNVFRMQKEGLSEEVTYESKVI